MAKVNLLPWRAERRKQREREFYMQLGAAFVAAVVVILLWSFWMGARIDNQNDRNDYLQGEIKQLDVRIATIKDLEKVREHLLARKKIIEQLQADRSQMVHLFDELVKTIPASARLKGLEQTGQSMKLDGVAQSNASVAEYMRNIQASPWMGHADLRKTEKVAESSRMPYHFGLTVSLSKPKTDEVAAGEGAAPGSSVQLPAKAATAGAPGAGATVMPPAKSIPPATARPPKAADRTGAPNTGGARP